MDLQHLQDENHRRMPCSHRRGISVYQLLKDRTHTFALYRRILSLCGQRHHTLLHGFDSWIKNWNITGYQTPPTTPPCIRKVPLTRWLQRHPYSGISNVSGRVASPVFRWHLFDYLRRIIAGIWKDIPEEIIKLLNCYKSNTKMVY